MAGLIGLTSSDIELQDALRVERWEHDGDWIPHPVVRLTTTLPIAVNKADTRVAVRARWGFPVGAGRPVGNARDDKLQVSPMWRSMLGKSHCLIATTGVYEQVEENGEKLNLWFRRPDGRPIVMPGLCAPRNMEGEARLCCAIITTSPNRFFGKYHDRQVCVLPTHKQMDAWMAATDPAEAVAMLHTAGDDEWEAQPVDGRIFKPGRREMEDLVPLGPPLRWGDATAKPARKRTATQGTL